MASPAYIVAPGGCFSGEVAIPGDKSISHRALILGAIAEGGTVIRNFLPGEDTLATLQALRQMGAAIHVHNDTEIRIEGRGLHGLQRPAGVIDAGNSGTSARLLAGLLSGQTFASELTGDRSLRRRPMDRIIIPLTMMGASITGTGENRLPLSIGPVSRLHGIEYRLPVASAQIKSAILLAGLYAEGKSCISEPTPTRDHTERLLVLFSHPVARCDNRICIEPAQRLVATEVNVPADLSSAAFFIVGACIAAESNIVLKNVGVNPGRNAIIEILMMMGANIELHNRRTLSNEPVADINVRASRLHGIEIPESLAHSAIDEFPAIMIAAAYAEGKTLVKGAAELRVKESDRIRTMAEGFMATGISANPTEDGMEIEGGKMQGGEVDSQGDHRVAMAFAVGGINAGGVIKVFDCKNVDTSFPGFVDCAARAGLKISQVFQ